jgi:C-terminal domain found in long catalases
VMRHLRRVLSGFCRPALPDDGSKNARPHARQSDAATSQPLPITLRGRSSASRLASSRAPTPTSPMSPVGAVHPALGATPLVIAPLGGVLKSGRRSVIVERTLLTARSIEYDALVVAAGTTPTRDIKLVVLLQEAFRHCKPVAAWDDGTAAPAAAGIDLGAPGVLVAANVGKSFTDALADAVGLHRVWERAVDVMASEVAPVR